MMDRVLKDIKVLGKNNCEEVAADSDRWMRVEATAKGLMAHNEKEEF